MHMPPSAPMEMQRSVYQYSKSLVSTSLTTSPGPWTPLPSSEWCNSTFTSRIALFKAHPCSRIKLNFDCCTIESILTNCFSVWYSSCTATGQKALQRVITGTQSPTTENIYHTCCLCRAHFSPSFHPVDVTGASTPAPAGSGIAFCLRLWPY